MRDRASRTRSTLACLLATAVLATVPSAALADPAGPTNYDSRVTSIEPAIDGLEVAVLGGDAYVELTVPPGSTATVYGYDPSGDELYLRFLPDGTVERNEASPTRWANDERYGALPPPDASAAAPPRWEPVADGGTYAWHDHRVHWMSPALPRHIDPAAGEPQLVQPWTLQLTVDDRPVEVTGELAYLPAPTPVIPVAVLVLVLGLGVWLALRRTQVAWVLTAGGAVAAGVVGGAAVLGLPPGADSEPALVVLPLVALGLLAVAAAIRDRPGVGAGVVSGLAGLPLVVWGILLGRGLISAIVPTALSNGLARVLIAAALGAGLAALVGAIRSAVTALARPVRV